MKKSLIAAFMLVIAGKTFAATADYVDSYHTAADALR